MMPVTRYLALPPATRIVMSPYTRYSILDTLVPLFHGIFIPVSPCHLAHVSPRAVSPHAHSEFKCSFEEYPCSPSERLETSNLTLGARPTT